MSQQNRLNKIVSKINRLPESLRILALSKVIGRVIKFAGTAKVRVEKLTEREAVVYIANRKRVQNHIGGVHAAAMALLAESATGFVCGMNVPDDKVLVIKSMKVEFLKRSTGSMRAVARLSDDQINEILTTEKGDVDVEVTVTDEANIEPINCEMIWAWVPKRRN